MPRLLLFVPCQKLILSKEDNSASLISIFQGFAVGRATPEAAIPEGTAIPMPWYALTLWYKQAWDAGKTFEQYIALFGPSGTELIRTHVSTFEMIKRHHRVYSKVDVFPVWQAGEYTLRLFMREKDDGDWQQCADYPINVRHSQQPEAGETEVVDDKEET